MARSPILNGKEALNSHWKVLDGMDKLQTLFFEFLIGNGSLLPLGVDGNARFLVLNGDLYSVVEVRVGQLSHVFYHEKSLFSWREHYLKREVLVLLLSM